MYINESDHADHDPASYSMGVESLEECMVQRGYHLPYLNRLSIFDSPPDIHGIGSR
ncbi:hypothetical protein BDN72DRAFT_847516 [Pluteus cervinus]|uniref:Uncharacterized protein n=1 Tax=Pluteus cervinus TaxID=181527 RepID=A0ACD3AD12_9AGAR|nr:hypothetical protein BDN72DRAFT_847516 [Pluteus cervinus]